VVRVPRGGGAVQGGDGGSWRGRQRWCALAWEATATGAGAGVGGGGTRGAAEREQGWVGFHFDSTRAYMVKRSKIGIRPYILSPTHR